MSNRPTPSSLILGCAFVLAACPFDSDPKEGADATSEDGTGEEDAETGGSAEAESTAGETAESGDTGDGTTTGDEEGVTSDAGDTEGDTETGETTGETGNDTQTETTEDTETTDATCQDASDCGDTQICDFDGVCTAAWGHTYRVEVLSVDVDTTDADDLDWDPLAGAPDPFWVLWVDGQSVYTSTGVTDEFFASWRDEGVDVLLSEPVELQVDFWDEDVTEHDPIQGFVWDPVPQEQLHEGIVQIDGDVASMIISFQLVE